jgi:hypothetical protein
MHSMAILLTPTHSTPTFAFFFSERFWFFFARESAQKQLAPIFVATGPNSVCVSSMGKKSFIHAMVGCRPVLAVEFDPYVGMVVSKRIITYLSQTSPLPILTPTTTNPLNVNSLPSGSTVITIGNTTLSRSIVSDAEVAAAGPDGFVVRVSRIGAIQVIAANGNGPDPYKNTMLSSNLYQVPTGRHYAAFAILEKLGFGWFHPLQPVIPPKISLSPLPFVNFTESPRWPVRMWHYHTEHPLELTNFFNGWGQSDTTFPEWQKFMPDYSMFLEWLVANRQNGLEFVLLSARTWKEFAIGPDRQQRYTLITQLANQWGVAVGADVPIATQQQHGWYMTDGMGSMKEQIAQIQRRVDWLVQAGFNFISTESGFSEFTHPNCTEMLNWMNVLSTYTQGQYGRQTYIKAHISSGQFCPEFADPVTGVRPCNFNYLPHYAEPSLGVMPHTVQYYTFDDPAPTYGQRTFSSMLNYTFVEAPKRSTLYYGETAYWVNYDVDVPLFLPIYASARLKDLLQIKQREDAGAAKISGTNNFESGWEWGYWLQNTLTARASYTLIGDASDPETAYQQALNLLTRHWGPSNGDQLNALLRQISAAQLKLLVWGTGTYGDPSSVPKKNGQAYLQGWDTWATLAAVVTPDSLTQPLALSLEEMKAGLGDSFYSNSVSPLLTDMENQFQQFYQSISAMYPSTPSHVASLMQDLIDSMHITYVRAKFVHAVYDSTWLSQSVAWRTQRLADAVAAANEARVVIQKREAQYRVPLERIAGWEYNPTAYSYGYLWTVHSMYYYYRDLYRAVSSDLSTVSPCFMNIISPVDVGTCFYSFIKSQYNTISYNANAKCLPCLFADLSPFVCCVYSVW